MKKQRKQAHSKEHNNTWGHGHEVLGTATLGERGQVVIPSDIRHELNLHTGDKLIVMVQAGALHMIKADMLRGMISKMSKQLGKFK